MAAIVKISLAVALNVRGLLQMAREDLVWVLLVVGVWTSSTAVRAAATAPPEWVVLIGDYDGHAYRYYMAAVAAAFIGGVATMWAAVWVSVAAADARRGAGIEQWILCAALVPFVLAVGLLSDSTTTEINFNA